MKSVANLSCGRECSAEDGQVRGADVYPITRVETTDEEIRIDRRSLDNDSFIATQVILAYYITQSSQCRDNYVPMYETALRITEEILKAVTNNLENSFAVFVKDLFENNCDYMVNLPSEFADGIFGSPYQSCAWIANVQSLAKIMEIKLNMIHAHTIRSDDLLTVTHSDHVYCLVSFLEDPLIGQVRVLRFQARRIEFEFTAEANKDVTETELEQFMKLKHSRQQHVSSQPAKENSKFKHRRKAEKVVEVEEKEAKNVEKERIAYELSLELQRKLLEEEEAERALELEKRSKKKKKKKKKISDEDMAVSRATEAAAAAEEEEAAAAKRRWRWAAAEAEAGGGGGRARRRPRRRPRRRRRSGGRRWRRRRRRWQRRRRRQRRQRRQRWRRRRRRRRWRAAAAAAAEAVSC